jgi:hypothetical protein
VSGAARTSAATRSAALAALLAFGAAALARAQESPPSPAPNGPPASAPPAAAAPRAPVSTSREQQALADAIDAELVAAWSEQKLAAAAPADDATWLRRLSLDLRGTIPSAEEAAAFLADGAPDKRARRVDAFLADRRFSENLAVLWTDLLLSNAGKNAGRMEQWLETWLQEQFEQGATTADVARHVIADSEWTLKPGPLSYLLSYHDTIEVVSGVTARAFLGLQIQCAQCHDHPYDRWKRDDFNRFTSFFADVRADHLKGGDPLFRVFDRDPEWDLEDRLTHLLQASRRARKNGGGGAMDDGNAPMKPQGRPTAKRGPKGEGAKSQPDGAKPAGDVDETEPGGKGDAKNDANDESTDVMRGTSMSETVEADFDESALLEVLKLCKNAPKGTSPFASVESDAAALTALFERLPSSARELCEKYREHRTLFHEAGYLDGQPYAAKEGTTKRAALAAWLVDAKNPWFGRAIANRFWGRLFGKGLVDPVDDLTGSQDRILAPLLDRVAAEFVAHGTDPRFLVGALVRTKAYALGNARGADVAECERAERWCAAHPVRNLTAYEMANSLVAAVAPDEGRGSPADRAAAADHERRKLVESIASYFGGKDGASDGNPPSIPQSLFLMNGSHAERAERFGRGKALDRFQDETKPLEDRLRDLFLATLGRPPTAAEVERVAKLMKPGASAAVEDVLWALLNSTEFRSNH